MIQHAARARLEVLRRRGQRANDLLDSVVTINTPADIAAELDQLKASYEVVNSTAKGQAGWDEHYAEFARYYAATRPRLDGFGAWFTTGQGALNQIRQRSRRLEEWKTSLQAEKVPIKEPPKKDPEETTVGGVLDKALWVVGGLALLAVVSK